jgi:isocitrate dehydrogenase kinase/phosphatase
MTDILEYSTSRFRAAAFRAGTAGRVADVAPSQVEEEGDRIVVRHLYIERRMTPLNLYLEGADDAQRIHAVASTETPSASWPSSTSSPATCCSRISA